MVKSIQNIGKQCVQSINLQIHLPLLLILLSLCSCAEKRVLNPPRDLIGSWRGNSSFYVDPVRSGDEKYKVDYEFQIDGEGRITGHLGQAEILESYLVHTSKFLQMLGNEPQRSYLKLRGKLLPDRDFRDGDGFLFVREVYPDSVDAGFNCYSFRNGKKVRLLFGPFPMQRIR
ncbi:MAG: hypothetical protein PHI68_01025 [Candidatus Cloacimonetes bacterium]|nr:hypothetical protein [Candidatus Cloacimonadota bacterium]